MGTSPTKEVSCTSGPRMSSESSKSARAAGLAMATPGGVRKRQLTRRRSHTSRVVTRPDPASHDLTTEKTDTNSRGDVHHFTMLARANLDSSSKAVFLFRSPGSEYGRMES